MRAYIEDTDEYIYPENGFKGLSVFYGVLEGYRVKGVHCLVQRATGVKDSEGEEIYEGDEISIDYGKKRIEVGTVVYDSGCFLIYNDETDFVEYLGVRKFKKCKLLVL